MTPEKRGRNKSKSPMKTPPKTPKTPNTGGKTSKSNRRGQSDARVYNVLNAPLVKPAKSPGKTKAKSPKRGRAQYKSVQPDSNLMKSTVSNNNKYSDKQLVKTQIKS